jgi:hypothetical protein
MPTVIGVRGEKQFVELARQLRGPQNKVVRREAGKAIRAAAKPVVTDVKRAVMAVPSSHGSRGSSSRIRRAAHQTARFKSGKQARLRGLRATIAASTGVQTNLSNAKPSVKIVVRRSSLPPDQRRLPSRLNRLSGWRHPVFGNREIWVNQKGRPYFDVTIRRHTPALRRAVVRAVDRAAQQVARGV